MAEYFEPVSVLSLGAVLGLADVDAETLRRWFAALADGGTNFERDPEKQARSDAACAEIDERARTAARPARARARRVDDLAHDLVRGRGRATARPRERYLPSLKVILLGGMQEPGHGAGSVLYALLAHPEQLRRFAPTSTRCCRRRSTRACAGSRRSAPWGGGRPPSSSSAGRPLPADAPVAAVISSANRDPARFADPDRFDLHRERGRLATFGFGHHFCSGHAFAKAQERIALRALLERHGALELAAEPPHQRLGVPRAP